MIKLTRTYFEDGKIKTEHIPPEERRAQIGMSAEEWQREQAMARAAMTPEIRNGIDKLLANTSISQDPYNQTATFPAVSQEEANLLLKAP